MSCFDVAPEVKIEIEGIVDREVDAQGNVGKTITANSSNPGIDVSEPYTYDVARSMSCCVTVLVGSK
jgi:hypothetical protein